MFFLCLGAFWWCALLDMTAEIKNNITIFKKYYGMNVEQKNEALIGDLYELVQKCRKLVPEMDSIALITDNLNTSLYLSYYLTPRKIYSPGDEVPPLNKSIDEVNIEWIKKKNIKWLLCYFSKNPEKNKIIRIRNHTNDDDTY